MLSLLRQTEKVMLELIVIVAHVITPKPAVHLVPDAGTTFALLSIAMGTIMSIRAKLK